jgi:hypothetical protein
MPLDPRRAVLNGPAPSRTRPLERDAVPDFAHDLVFDIIPGDYGILRGLVVGVADIRPPAAAAILEHYRNESNRAWVQANLQRLTRAMADDAFPLNGESVVFSDVPLLLDAHHRLQACVLASRPFTSVVVIGVRPGVAVTLDAGSSRTDAHRLSMDGYKHAETLSGAIHILVSFCRNQSVYRTPVVPYHEKIGAWIPAHPNLVESVAFARAHSGALRFFRSQAVVAFCHYVTRAADAPLADIFWNALVSKNAPPQPGGTVVSKLIDRLVNEARVTQGHGTVKRTIDSEKRILYTFLAWRAFCRGEDISKLQLPSGGKTPRLPGLQYTAGDRPVLHGWSLAEETAEPT